MVWLLKPEANVIEREAPVAPVRVCPSHDWAQRELFATAAPAEWLKVGAVDIRRCSSGSSRQRRKPGVSRRRRV